MITYEVATLEAIPGLMTLQKRYHVDTISDEDRPQGFVTTLFTPEQMGKLIEEEQGIVIARAPDGEIIGYAMNGSWDYWSAWPLFQHMIADLPGTVYKGIDLTTANTYQYGPICVDTRYRGQKVFQNLMERSRRHFGPRYPVMITFVNAANPHSSHAHIDGAGMDLIKTFDFNQNHYLELGILSETPIRGHTLDQDPS